MSYITLTTEPGTIGGLSASGHEFGPASNSAAIQGVREREREREREGGRERERERERETKRERER